MSSLYIFSSSHDALFLPLAPTMIPSPVRVVPKNRVDELREWFRLYKTAEGKGENKFGLGEKAMGAEFALKVARHTHDTWRALGFTTPGLAAADAAATAAAESGPPRPCSFGKNGPCWVGSGLGLWNPPPGGSTEGEL